MQDIEMELIAQQFPVKTDEPKQKNEIKYAVEFSNLGGVVNIKYYKTMKGAIKEYNKYINNTGYYTKIEIIDIKYGDVLKREI
jgi:hypothetical protein